jgi:ABC-2 type transport system permease protein
VNGPLIHRLLVEQRVRLALEFLFVSLWGFLLVALFATSSTFNAMLDQEAQLLGPVYKLMNLDPLAQWASIGVQHPLFYVGGGMFAIGLGVRAIAGELEDGSLALAITRPISRRSWFASHVAVMVPGSILLGVMYGVGCLVAALVTTPKGHLTPSWMLLAGGEAGLVLLSFGSMALMFSAFASERGRALAWSVGALIVMYAVSYLLPLWSVAENAAKLTPFGWFRPGELIQHGTIPWGDVVALVLFSAIPLVVAAWQFSRRDLAGG